MREGLSVVRRGLPAILAGIGLLLGGCASTGAGGDGLGYYWQSLRGQIHLLQASRPIDDWLQDDNLAPALRERLLAAQRMRSFAVQRLGLPDNASYRRYADLQRPFAVWNVVAAPPDSLELHRWCFPVAGCVGYRGYFSEADAVAQARLLADQGLESGSYGVPAYSTLGYLNWLGAIRCSTPSWAGARASSPACCSMSWPTRWSTWPAIPPSTNPLPPPWSAWAQRCGWPPRPAQPPARAGSPASCGVRSGGH